MLSQMNSVNSNVRSEYSMTALTPELYCTSIEESLNFYTKILDFDIQYQRQEDRFAMLERQGARIMLEEINHDSKSKSHRTWISGILEKPFGRGVNLQIMTTMISELYAHVQHANADIFLPIEEKWYRVNDVEVGHRQFIVLDPDGYMLRFVEDLGVRKSK